MPKESATADNTSPEAVSPLTKRSAKPERGEILQIRTDSFAFEGKAVGRREDGYVIFVEGALANELIEVEIFKAKGRFAEAKLKRVIESSPDRRTPLCPYFGICGGCALQHMDHQAQRYWKRAQVVDLFERIGKIAAPNVLEVISDTGREFHYRNKMEFSFSEERWLTEEEIEGTGELDRFALGLHVRGRYDRVLDTAVCFLPQQVVVDVLNFARRFAREYDLGVFDPDDKPDGLLRFLAVRTSHATGELMVNFVTSRRDDRVLTAFTKELLENVPMVTTVVNNINGRRAQVSMGDEEIVYHGSGTITDRIGKISFQISANSFFQTNTPQAEVLYSIACDYAALRPDDILWDLYCGAGTITLFASDRVKHVVGIELAESSIRDARANAIANNVEHVEFVSSDLRKALTTPEFLANYPRPNVMIIDPPRSGMHPDVVREVLALAPERIAYISCNPATQARDIALMLEQYSLEAVQPVEMFPQTYHIESVAKLIRRK